MGCDGTAPTPGRRDFGFGAYYDGRSMADSPQVPSGSSVPAPSLPPVAIVVSRFNGQITQNLLDGAVGEYERLGGKPADLLIAEAPGAYELPALSLAAAKTGRFRGVVALGCLVRGQTRHDRHIAEAVSHGLVDVTIQTGVPVTFGVLTTKTVDQATARAGGKKGNKGADAMAAVLETIAVMDGIVSGQQKHVRLTSQPADKSMKDGI